MEQFELKPVPQKLVPGRSLAQLAQLVIDLGEKPGYVFEKLYPDFEPAAKRVEWDQETTDVSAAWLRLLQHAFKEALGGQKPDAARVVMLPDDIFHSVDDYARSLAVMAVDGKHGFTMEFNVSPAEHREQYDIAEENIKIGIEAAMKGYRVAWAVEDALNTFGI